MRYKYVFVLLALIGGGWLILNQWQKPTDEAESKPVNQQVLSEKKKPQTVQLSKENTNQQKTQQQEISSEKDAEQMDQLYAQFDERRFSDNLHVEVASVFMEYVGCIDMTRISELDDYQQNLKRTKLLSDLKSYCEAMEKSYPLLKTDYFKNLDKQAFINQSDEGLLSLVKRLQEDLSIEAFNGAIQDFIGESYRQKNGQFLSMIQLMTGYRYDAFAFEANVLGGVDVNYLRSIRYVALTKLSCDFQEGETCSQLGRFMLEKCISDTSTCGMTFEAWYQGFTSPGIKADVELLSAFYQNN
ncbi:hypothetical protein [Marinicella sp. W31]|uniref:hypothetical protein n=1 Tax=Marinicella sp. W31 TaxID=3023713 RepID=UPI003757AECC